MYKFFVDESAIGEDCVTISGDDYNHIANVLRMKTGEEFLVGASSDREYLCKIDSFAEGCVKGKILDCYGSNRELPLKVTLYQALPKGDKMETIIQKAVELGVNRIVPVMTDRVIVKLDDKKREKKVARWNAVSLAAAKQSKRSVVPVVAEPMSYKDAVGEASTFDYAIIPYENASGMEGSRDIIRGIVDGCVGGDKRIGVFIGPEGGFSEGEIELATESGIEPVTLGHRILRTETAGMTVLSILMFMSDRD